MPDLLSVLYKTAFGRFLLKPLVSRRVSQLAGAFLDRPCSRFLIPLFVRKNQIDLSEYETEGWNSFNDCFSRKIKAGMRRMSTSPSVLAAPCDGLLRAYPIQDGTVLPVKESRYTIASLLRSEKLAKRFDGGTCLVFRLCVNHYHRYSYIESGEKSRNVFIPGVLHTVRPVALRERPVFTENCREYTLIRTENAGTILQMEVGAMLVGRIVNLQQEAQVKRGQEKGYFAYGGSTIIVLLQKNRAVLSEQIMSASGRGEETPVKLGEKIGTILDRPVQAGP